MEKYHNEEDITKEKSQEEGYQEENSDLRNSRESLKETAHGTLESADDWECKLCQYRTTKKQLILNHYKRVHTNIRDYKCDQCGKEFTQKRHVETHKREVHEGIKDYKCEQCGQAFGERKNLKRHKRAVHEGIKDFKCNECHYGSTKKIYLLRHMRSAHNDGTIEVYQCDLCDDDTFEKKKMNIHRKEVHNKTNDHICECGFSTTYKENLRRHKRTVHLDIKDFRCNKCDFACNEKRKLKKHRRNIHKIDEAADASFMKAAVETARNTRLDEQSSPSNTIAVDETTVIDSRDTPAISNRTTNKFQPLQSLTPVTPPLEKQRMRNLEGADYFRAMQNKNHKEVEFKLKMFKCNRCQFTAWSREDMTTHMTKMHGKSFKDVAPDTPEHKDNSNEAKMFPWILPDEEVEPAKSKEVAKESNAGIALVKLGKCMSLQKVPNVLIDPESSNMITIEKPPYKEPQKIWRVATKGVTDGDKWSLKGIEDKISSVGNWLDKIKGKK